MSLNIAVAQYPHTRTIDLRIGQQRPAITCIAQDIQGLIWAGSDLGLLRTDGDRVDLVLRAEQGRVNAIAAYKDGVIVAVEKGDLLWFHGSTCDTLFSDTTWLHSRISALVVGTNGVIYAATYGAGVSMLSMSGSERLWTGNGLPDDHVNDICLLPDGSVAVATDQGVAKCKAGKVIRVFGEAQGAPDNLILTVASAGDGRIWAGTDNAGAFLWDPALKKDTALAVIGAGNGHVRGILVRQGLLWAATATGGPVIYDVGNGSGSYSPGPDAAYGVHPVRDFLEGRNGSVWWCDGTEHLHRADPSILVVQDHEGLDLTHISALCSDHKGNIWFATPHGVFRHDASFLGSGKVYRASVPIDPRRPVVSMDVGRDGTLWAASFGNGLMALHPDGRMEHFDAEHGGIDPNVLSVKVRDDEVWASTLTGMVRVRNAKAERFASPGVGFMFMVLPMPDGTVLGATDGSGLVQWKDGQLKPISPAGPRTFYSVVRDSRGEVWAAGPGTGLCKLGDSLRIGADRPPFDGEIFTLTELGDHLLAFGSTGCAGYDPKTGYWVDLTKSLGLEGVVAELNAVCHDDSGALWLASSKGLLRLQPAQWYFDPRSEAVISNILVGNSEVDVAPAIFTAFDRNSITFRYTAPCYVDPSALRFEYRLAGLNDRTVITQEREVSYPALSPGSYTFEVRAFVGREPMGSTWTSVRIHVAPPWWRRPWVIIGAVLLSVALAIWGIRTRERHLLDFQRMEQEQVRFQLEALRSQVDPHFLFNSFNTLVDLIETDEKKAVEHVADLSTFFRNILQVRDSALIPLSEELGLLHTYFTLEQRRFGEAIQLELRVPEEAVDHQIVPLTLQLVVENAIKHNRASLEEPLLIRIATENDHLVVSNPARERLSPPPSTGFGLSSIRKRYAALSKKQVEITSAHGVFTVKIPLLNRT
ncbi:MAG: histidine kinase [Flavobacteriales bacterium]|nr:histidine kinase [Flavobacteriales bacterium]